MSISANYPALRPALLLDFANSQQLDPRVTFSRSTTAPYYDGKTSALAEQNLFLQSNAFTNSYWYYIGGIVSVASGISDPIGGTTAYQISATSANTNNGLFENTVGAPLGSTISIYAKAGNVNYLAIGSANPNAWASFNLSTGNPGNSFGCTTSMVSLGGGWYRCIMANITSALSRILFAMKSTDVTTDPWSNGTVAIGDYIYVWQAQLEQRSSATAYNATTTSALTNYIPQLLTAPINQPRFDFNPTTGESLGLLIEQSSTNLLTYSSDYTNAIWTKVNATITATANIAPDGTQTAQLITDTTASGYHGTYQAYTVTAGTSYTQTVYVKKNNMQYAVIGMNFSGSVGTIAQFDLNTGVLVYSAASGTGCSIVGTSSQAVGNGWYRLSITSIIGTGFTSQAIYVGMFPTVITSGQINNNAYVGTGYSSIYIWGAQLEALAFPTSYIPTTSAQVTRASDNASMTGTNFSSWYNQGQGTLYANFSRINNGSNLPAIFTTDSFLAYANSTDEVAKNIGANNQITITSSGTNEKKTAYIYSNAGYGFVVNGAGYVNNASPILQATFLNFNPSGNLACNRIKKFAYYPQALTSAQLQSLTGS